MFSVPLVFSSSFVFNFNVMALRHFILHVATGGLCLRGNVHRPIFLLLFLFLSSKLHLPVFCSCCSYQITYLLVLFVLREFFFLVKIVRAIIAYHLIVSSWSKVVIDCQQNIVSFVFFRVVCTLQQPLYCELNIVLLLAALLSM
uniref:Uncharacterized protein n=1 Tax=Sipha flava TaxID=143950 RepID=A0A2S2Q0I7_9HEMI